MKLSTHLRLVSRLRMRQLYLHSPKGFYGEHEVKTLLFSLLRRYIRNNASVQRNLVKAVCAVVLFGAFCYYC